MDAADAAEQIREAIAEEREEQKVEQEHVERFRSHAALLIAVIAVLMAVAGLGGDNVAEEMVSTNIQASDTWAFYQAKNVRQNANRLAADALEAQMAIHGKSLDPAVREDFGRKIQKYKDTAERYEDEPDPKAPGDPLQGDGKKQLMARARNWEAQRERATAQDPIFDDATVLYQIAIVLGSVAILATSRQILVLSLVFAILATLLMLNGFFLLLPLPL